MLISVLISPAQAEGNIPQVQTHYTPSANGMRENYASGVGCRVEVEGVVVKLEPFGFVSLCTCQHNSSRMEFPLCDIFRFQ